MATSRSIIRRYIKKIVREALMEATDPIVKKAEIDAAAAELKAAEAKKKVAQDKLKTAQALKEDDILLTSLLEAEEEAPEEDKGEDKGEEEENPFASAAGGEEEGGDEEAGKEDDSEEKEAPSKPAQPAGIPIKFNTSRVKKYNQAQFTTDTGIVKSIDKRGVVVTTQPDGVDVLVNFNDISETAKRFFKTKK